MEEQEGEVLDLLVILDATGSMGSYIESAKDNIIELCSILRASGRLKSDDGLQVGLLAYRDYPDEQVVLPHPFTSNLENMKGYLAGLEAKGGADNPEAFGTALAYANDEMEGWRDDSLKVIIVITDAAPHGIKEEDDAWEEGAPPGKDVRDPLEVAREMATLGYSIFVLACEPTLGETTQYAIEFYKAISALTLGAFCSLTNSKLLASVIIGLVLEKIDLRRLSIVNRDEIWKLVFEEGKSIEDVVGKIHHKLSSQNQQVTSMHSGSLYNDLPAAMGNYKVFISSNTLAEARNSLERVTGVRHSLSAKKSMVKRDRESESARARSFTVSVAFKNTGSDHIELQSYDAESGRMKEQIVVPNGHIRLAKLVINIPVNFVLICGRIRKNFCRTFTRDSDIDVEQVFSQS